MQISEIPRSALNDGPVILSPQGERSQDIASSVRCSDSSGGKYNSTETNYNITPPQNDIKNVPSPKGSKIPPQRGRLGGVRSCHSEFDLESILI